MSNEVECLNQGEKGKQGRQASSNFHQKYTKEHPTKTVS
jgi:hypothetical protein